MKKSDAERILVNFYAWHQWEYERHKLGKKHKTVGDVIKYYLKTERGWNDK